MSTQVLVIDSNREFAILLRQSLEESGSYQVSLAASGKDALELADDHAYDLAIVDLDLQDFEGADLLGRLRSLQPDIKIVAIPMGGMDNLPDHEQLDIDGVLSKPFYLPDLPQILQNAIKQSEAPEQPSQESQPEVQASPPDRPQLSPELPEHLQSAAGASDALQQAVTACDARLALLLQAGKPVASSGEAGSAQLRQLAAAVPDLAAQKKSGVVARFLRLGEDGPDELLYATAIAGQMDLALLFPPEVPFGTARRQAEAARRRLFDPTSESETQASAAAAEEPDTPPAATAAELPHDWHPESELSSAQRAMIDEWAELNPPDADPGPEPAQASNQPTRQALPQDWVPRERPPEARLEFLEQVDVSTTQPVPTPAADGSLAKPMQEASYHLPFTAVLVPRFPEHQLTGALARQVREWTRRLCVAWDWRADEIEVQADALRLRVSLIPESAPAKAIERLRDDLSARILEHYPQFDSDLPSGRFWARAYLLTAGEPPPEAQIRGFIDHTRRAQGFSA